MTSLVPFNPMAEDIERIAERIADLMPTSETDLVERDRSAARSILLLQADRLEEATTDDFTLSRQAKEDDAAYAAFRQYCLERLPFMATVAKSGGHSESMLSFLRGDACDRRNMLHGAALLLKQLAEGPMDSETLEAAVSCMRLLPATVRI